MLYGFTSFILCSNCFSYRSLLYYLGHIIFSGSTATQGDKYEMILVLIPVAQTLIQFQHNKLLKMCLNNVVGNYNSQLRVVPGKFHNFEK